MESVTPGLWDFAAAAAWERQVEEQEREREEDESSTGEESDDSSGELSPTVGVSPAELWLRSLDEPGATLRVRREQAREALAKLTPLEQIKQRMLADAAARDQQARREQLVTLATSADDNKDASRHELRQRHDKEDAEQHESTAAELVGARGSEGARERFFRSLSRPKGGRKRSTVQRIQQRERNTGRGRYVHNDPGNVSSSSSSEESDSDLEDGNTAQDSDDTESVVDAEIARTGIRRRGGCRRKNHARRRAGGGVQSIMREQLRREAAVAALPTPTESEHATEAKAQLMSQSDSDVRTSTAAISSRAAKAEVMEDFAGLGWGVDSDDDDDQLFGEQHVTLGAPGGWSKSEVAIEWGTLGAVRQENTSRQVDVGNGSQRPEPLSHRQLNRPSTAGSSMGPSGLSEFGAILARRSLSSADSTRPAANGQRLVAKVRYRPHTTRGTRTHELSAPIVRQEYNERVEAENHHYSNTEHNEEEEEDKEDSTHRSIAVHTRLASAPIRRELATNVDIDALPLVKREPLPDKVSHRSSICGNGSSCRAGVTPSVAGSLEQATRAQKFFRSHKRFGLQPAGFRPDVSRAGSVAVMSGPDSPSIVSGPPPSSTAAALTNRVWSTSSSSGIMGGSMQGSATLTTSAAARADKTTSKWEHYHQYGKAGNGVERASQRHVAVPMAVAGCHSRRNSGSSPQQRAKSTSFKPRGTAAVAAAACRVQRSRAVAPHMQGPNSISEANFSSGSSVKMRYER